MNLLTNLHDSIFSLYKYIYPHTHIHSQTYYVYLTHAHELVNEYIILFQLGNS